MEKVYKTSKSDFEVFKKKCKKWIEFFGLKGWEIDFAHKDMGDSLACCSMGALENRSVTIILSTKWDIRPSVKELGITAFHEVCELLLMRLRVLCTYRYTTELEIKEEIHTLIRTLENVLYHRECKR